MAERVWNAANPDLIPAVFGSYDAHLNLIQKKFRVVIVNRGSTVKITGAEPDVDKALEAFELLMQNAGKGDPLSEQTVRYVVSMVADDAAAELRTLSADAVAVTVSGKPIRPRTVGQKQYLDAIGSNTIVLGIGPAGTGKTYLAVAMAVKALRAHEIDRIILTRPAVEAGEKLGFLPGDLQNKVDPYLRPLYDGLFDMLGVEAYNIYLQRGNIEVAPLAYMRGRTLDDAFIILDEAQNTTREQMKMFLTRLGVGSKAVITGDITQIDLPAGKKSGLVHAMRILGGIEGLEIVRFTEKDVVRHALVQRIIKAYEKSEEEAPRRPRRRIGSDNE